MWGSIIPAAISAVGSFLGGSDQNRSARKEAETQRDWSSSQAGIARDWEEKMSNTAHQREMADLAAAGLNPILAVSRGGAATPSAPMPSSAAAPTHNRFSGVSNSGYDYYKSEREREEIARLRQDRKIKAPLEKGAGYVGSGIDAIKPAVEAAVEGAMKAVEEVKGVGSKVAEAVSGTTAAAVETVKETALKYGVRISEVLDAPSKYVASVVNSAGAAVDVGRKANAALVQRTYESMPNKFTGRIKAGSFSGDREKDLADVLSLRKTHPKEFRDALTSYRLWYNNRR